MVAVKLRDIFREEDRDRFVPGSYQQALDQIVATEGVALLDPHEVEVLKSTMASHCVEGQVSSIILELFVPEELLTKTGRLTEAEFDIVRQHPLKGAQYLLDIPGVPRLAVVCAYEHHMKFDGSGYPRVAPGWQQNLCSQMTTISDVFDALRTRRSYRDSMDFDKIASILQEMAGTELHPLLTRNFLKVLTRISARQQS